MIASQITFRDMTSSETIRFDVQRRIDHLEKFLDRIVSCDVVVSEPTKRRHRGKLFHVQVKIHVPGKEIIINHDPERSGRHKDMRTAIGDAFDEAERQVEDYVCRRRVWKQDRTGKETALALFQEEAP